MQDLNESERRLFIASVGILVLTVAAFVLFFVGVVIGFYAFAAAAIGLGLYLAYGISKENARGTAKMKRKAGR